MVGKTSCGIFAIKFIEHISRGGKLGLGRAWRSDSSVVRYLVESTLGLTYDQHQINRSVETTLESTSKSQNSVDQTLNPVLILKSTSKVPAGRNFVEINVDSCIPC